MKKSYLIISGIIGAIAVGTLLFVLLSPEREGTGENQISEEHQNTAHQKKSESHSENTPSSPEASDSHISSTSPEDGQQEGRSENSQVDAPTESGDPSDATETGENTTENTTDRPPGIPKSTSVWSPGGGRNIEIEHFEKRKQSILNRLRAGGEEASKARGEIGMILREADRNWQGLGAFRSSLLEAVQNMRDPEQIGETLAFLVNSKGWNQDYWKVIQQIKRLPARHRMRMDLVEVAISDTPTEMIDTMAPRGKDRGGWYSTLREYTRAWKQFTKSQYRGASIDSDWRKEWKNTLADVKEYRTSVIEQQKIFDNK